MHRALIGALCLLVCLQSVTATAAGQQVPDKAQIANLLSAYLLTVPVWAYTAALTGQEVPDPTTFFLSVRDSVYNLYESQGALTFGVPITYAQCAIVSRALGLEDEPAFQARMERAKYKPPIYNVYGQRYQVIVTWAQRHEMDLWAAVQALGQLYADWDQSVQESLQRLH